MSANGKGRERRRGRIRRILFAISDGYGFWILTPLGFATKGSWHQLLQSRLDVLCIQSSEPGRIPSQRGNHTQWSMGLRLRWTPADQTIVLSQPAAAPMLALSVQPFILKRVAHIHVIRRLLIGRAHMLQNIHVEPCFPVCDRITLLSDPLSYFILLFRHMFALDAGLDLCHDEDYLFTIG
jgi:hypothetical protein